MTLETIGAFIGLGGLLLIISACVVPLLILLDIRGSRETFLRIAPDVPGFRSGTGWKAALGSFGYLAVIAMILLVIGSALIGPVASAEIEDPTLNHDEILVGDSVEISAQVFNPSDETETYTIELAADGESLADEELTIGPKEREAVAFTASFDTPGSYALSIVGVEVGELTVRDNIVIEEASLSDSEIESGDSVEVTANVSNLANESDTREVELRINDEVVDTQEVTIDANDEETIQFTWSPEDQGEYEVAIGDEPAGSLSVVEPEPEEDTSPDEPVEEEPSQEPTEEDSPADDTSEEGTPEAGTDAAGESDDALTEEELEAIFETTVENEMPDQMQIQAEANHEGGVFDVKISAYTEDAGELAYLIGGTAGAYSVVVGEGHGGERMEVELFNLAGEYAGSYHAEAAWAQSYYDGRMSDQEYSERVLETLRGP